MIETDVMKKQVGGEHYKKHKGLQPWNIIDAYGLNYYEGNILKYLLRDKTNRMEDLQKLIHYAEKELENISPMPDAIDQVEITTFGDKTTQHIAPEGFDFEEPISDESVASKVRISLLLNKLPYTLRHASTRVIILDPTDDSLISITFNSYEEFWTWVESGRDIKKDGDNFTEPSQDEINKGWMK